MRFRMLLPLALLPGLAHAQDTSTAPTSTPPVTPAAPVFNLSAPLGAASEFILTTSSRTTLDDVQVSAQPGSKITQAKLGEVRRSVTQGTERANAMTPLTITGKVFYKVTGRDGSGNTTLLTTVLQSVPAAQGQKVQQGVQQMDMKYIQVIAPDGQVKSVTVQSSTPVLQAVFSQLTPDKMQQMAEQNGTNLTNFYGSPLLVGQERNVTLTLDGQDLMQSVLTAMAGPDGQKVFGQVTSNPLTITTTTTYRGPDARGQHVFDQQSHYANWKLNLQSQDAQFPMTVTAELLDVQSNSTSTFRPDGLPAGTSLNLKLRMQLTTVTQGVQVSMTMNTAQTVTIKPR